MHCAYRRGSGVVVALLAIALSSASAQAQDYPSRAVKVITQGAAGSGPDVVARIVFDQLGRQWRQQPVIINVPGAGGSTAARQAVGAPNDGYTLYMPATSSFVVMPEMFPNLPFDLTRDFVRISLVADQPLTIAVAPSLGVNSIDELVALSKNKPGEILYAANARGTLPHLTAERLRMQTGANLTHIPYPGAAAGLQDLAAGRISMIIESLGSLMGAVQGGIIKPIAVTSAKRVPAFPNVPTVAETLPGFTATGWFALMAPAGTPEPIVAKLNRDVRTAVESPEVTKRFQDLVTYARPMSPEETTAFVKSEREAWQAVVKQVGFATQ